MLFRSQSGCLFQVSLASPPPVPLGTTVEDVADEDLQAYARQIRATTGWNVPVDVNSLQQGLVEEKRGRRGPVEDERPARRQRFTEPPPKAPPIPNIQELLEDIEPDVPANPIANSAKEERRRPDF